MCAVFNDGTILDKWEIKTNTDNGGERILPDIADGIEAKLKEKKIDKAEVEGIGIGLPGPIEEMVRLHVRSTFTGAERTLKKN